MFETDLSDLYSGDDERAEQAVERLAARPPELAQAVQAALVAGLSADDPEKRWWSVRGLAALPGESAAPHLLTALADPEPQVRQCAALGLRQHPRQEALPGLIAMLEDPDSLSARLAADALIAVGKAAGKAEDNAADNPATLALIEVLEHGSHPAKLHALRALAAIADTRSIPALFEAFNNDSALMEYWADLGLNNMGVGTSFFLPD